MREEFKRELDQIKVDSEMKKRILTKLEASQLEQKADQIKYHNMNVYSIQIKDHKKTLRRKVGLAASILLGFIVIGTGIYQLYGSQWTGVGGNSTIAQQTTEDKFSLIDYVEIEYTDEDLKECLTRLENNKWSEEEYQVELVYLSDNVAVVKANTVIVVYDMNKKQPSAVIDSKYYEKVCGEQLYFDTVLVDSEGQEVYIVSTEKSGSKTSQYHIFNIEKQSFRSTDEMDQVGKFVTQVNANENNKLRYYIEREVWFPSVYVEPEENVYYFTYGNNDFYQTSIVKYDLNKKDEDGRIEQTVYYIGSTDMVETKMIYSPLERDNNFTWSVERFTDEELEETKAMVLEYYSDKEIYLGKVEKCEVYEESDLYSSYFDTTDVSDIVVYKVYLKDSVNPPRIIVLRRENKQSHWEVVNEGY